MTSPTTVTLSWSEIAEAFYYTVQYRVGSSGAWTTAGSVPGTSIDLTGLLANTVYTWRVKASCSVYSSVATFNTGAGGSGNNPSCSQPSNLLATPLSNTSVVLSWSAIPEAFDYTVQYRVGLSGTWITAGTVPGTNLTLSGLLENTEYSWRVKASCSEYSSVAVFTTGGQGGGGGGNTQCSAPSNTNTDAVFPTTANVSWEAQGGALSYKVQYRQASAATYITVGTFSTTNATITGLAPNTEYVWRVKADCSPWGSDVQFSTPQLAGDPGVFERSEDNAAAELPALKVFPNPATSGWVQVNTGIEQGELLLLNASGQVVARQTLAGPVQGVDVSNLPNGLYMVRLVGEDGDTAVEKLMIGR